MWAVVVVAGVAVGQGLPGGGGSSYDYSPSYDDRRRSYDYSYDYDSRRRSYDSSDYGDGDGDPTVALWIFGIFGLIIFLIICTSYIEDNCQDISQPGPLEDLRVLGFVLVC